MDSAALYVLAAALGLAAMRLRFDRALLVVLLTLLLVPAFLVLPVQGLGAARITRIVFVAFLVSLPGRRRRGEIDGAALGLPRPGHGAVLAMLVVGAAGVGLAGSGLDLRGTVEAWLVFVDQAVLLAIGVVATRALGPRRVLDGLLVALAVSIAIGAWEFLADSSWSRLFPGSDAQSMLVLNPLEERGGIRIRSGASFALEFGWVVAMLLPLAVQRLGTRLAPRWRAALVALVLAGGTAILWTRSRSALVAVAVGVVLLAIFSGLRRHVAVPVVIVALAAGAVLLSTDAVQQIYDLDRPTGTTGRDVRLDRLPGILGEVAVEPYTGLGLGGLRAEGYETPDNGWLLLYTDTGVVGLAAYGAAVALAIVTTSGALRARRSPDRDIAAAVLAAMVLWVGANATYDASNLGLSGPLFWLLAGVGVVLAERTPARRLGPVRRGLLVGAGAGALLAALITPMAASAHVARTYQFQTLPSSLLARTSVAYDHHAFAAEASVCQAMAALEDHLTSGADIHCVEPGVYQPLSGDFSVYVPGVGRMRVEAPTTEDLDAVEHRILEVGNRLVHFELRQLSPDRQGLPTPIRTAPVWVPLALGFLALFWPRAGDLSAASGSTAAGGLHEAEPAHP